MQQIIILLHTHVAKDTLRVSQFPYIEAQKLYLVAASRSTCITQCRPHLCCLRWRCFLPSTSEDHVPSYTHIPHDSPCNIHPPFYSILTAPVTSPLYNVACLHLRTPLSACQTSTYITVSQQQVWVLTMSHQREQKDRYFLGQTKPMHCNPIALQYALHIVAPTMLSEIGPCSKYLFTL